MAAADEAELMHMVATQATIDDALRVRYPRGDGHRRRAARARQRAAYRRRRIIKEGTSVALLSLGTRLQECLKAASELESYGVSVTSPMRASPSARRRADRAAGARA